MAKQQKKEEMPVEMAGEKQKQDKMLKNKTRKSGKSKKTDGLEEKLIELEKEKDELKDKYLRLFAEFDNYKKRTVKERFELMKTAAEDTMRSILPVLDDFDRAKSSADDESSEEVWSEGVLLVFNRLHNVLKGAGLESMTSTGEAFDPELHEAITEIPAPSEDMKGKVMDTIEKGYYLKDKIIRHAKVVVGK